MPNKEKMNSFEAAQRCLFSPLIGMLAIREKFFCLLAFFFFFQSEFNGLSYQSNNLKHFL